MINGVKVKTPTNLEPGIFRISEGDRTASGRMVLEVIAIKRRLDIQYALIEDTELKQILDLFESSSFCDITYPDPQKGEDCTLRFYTGDIKTPVGQKIKGTRYYQNVTFAVIEQ